jgi:hypothetical protein
MPEFAPYLKALEAAAAALKGAQTLEERSAAITAVYEAAQAASAYLAQQTQTSSPAPRSEPE